MFPVGWDPHDSRDRGKVFVVLPVPRISPNTKYIPVFNAWRGVDGGRTDFQNMGTMSWRQVQKNDHGVQVQL